MCGEGSYNIMVVCVVRIQILLYVVVRIEILRCVWLE